MPKPEGQLKIEEAYEKGYSRAAIQGWVEQKRLEALEKGHRPEAFDAWIGNRQFNDRPIEQYAQDQRILADNEADGWWDNWVAGFQGSASGLALRGELPETFTPEDADRGEQIFNMLGAVMGDIPAMFVGAVGGTGFGAVTGPGAAVTGMAGAFALPAVLRESLMQAYENGEVQDFEDFWNRFSAVMIAGAKGGVVGAATGGAVVALGPAGLALPRAAVLGGELTTMVTLGAAVEGHVPRTDDFINGAIVLGGLKVAVHGAGRLRTAYTRSNKTVEAVLEESETNPSIREEILSENRELPSSFEAPNSNAHLADADAVARARVQAERMADSEVIVEAEARGEEVIIRSREVADAAGRPARNVRRWLDENPPPTRLHTGELERMSPIERRAASRNHARQLREWEREYDQTRARAGREIPPDRGPSEAVEEAVRNIEPERAASADTASAERMAEFDRESARSLARTRRGMEGVASGEDVAVTRAMIERERIAAGEPRTIVTSDQLAEHLRGRGFREIDRGALGVGQPRRVLEPPLGPDEAMAARATAEAPTVPSIREIHAANRSRNQDLQSSGVERGSLPRVEGGHAGPRDVQSAVNIMFQEGMTSANYDNVVGFLRSRGFSTVERNAFPGGNEPVSVLPQGTTSDGVAAPLPTRVASRRDVLHAVDATRTLRRERFGEATASEEGVDVIAEYLRREGYGEVDGNAFPENRGFQQDLDMAVRGPQGRHDAASVEASRRPEAEGRDFVSERLATPEEVIEARDAVNERLARESEPAESRMSLRRAEEIAEEVDPLRADFLGEVVRGYNRSFEAGDAALDAFIRSEFGDVTALEARTTRSNIRLGIMEQLEDVGALAANVRTARQARFGDVRTELRRRGFNGTVEDGTFEGRGTEVAREHEPRMRVDPSTGRGVLDTTEQARVEPTEVTPREVTPRDIQRELELEGYTGTQGGGAFTERVLDPGEAVRARTIREWVERNPEPLVEDFSMDAGMHREFESAHARWVNGRNRLAEGEPGGSLPPRGAPEPTEGDFVHRTLEEWDIRNPEPQPNDFLQGDRTVAQARSIYSQARIQHLRDRMAASVEAMRRVNDEVSADLMSPELGGSGQPPSGIGPRRGVPGGQGPPPTDGDIMEAHIGSSKKTRTMTRWNEFVTNWVDRNHPIRVALRKMADNQPVQAVLNAYRKARNFAGMQGLVDSVLMNNTYDFKTGLVVGRGLRKIIRPVRNKMREFNHYLIAKRVVELEADNATRIAEGRLPREHGFERDIDTVNRTIERHQAEFEAVRTELIKFQAEVLKYLKDSGVISAEFLDLILAENPNYTPFYRIFEGFEPGQAGQPMRVRNPMRQLTGSGELLHNPMESIIKNTAMYIEIAGRSDVINTFIRAVKELPKGAHWGRKVPDPVRATRLSGRELREILDRVRRDPEAELTAAESDAITEQFTVFRMGRANAGVNQVVSFVEGRREVWELQPDVARVLNGLDREAVNSVVKFFSHPTHLLRSGAVLSPEFITRNISRDTWSAFLVSRNGFVPVVDTLNGTVNLFREHILGGDRIFQLWQRSGAAQAELAQLGRDYGKKNLRNILGATGMMDHVRNVVTTPVDLLRVLSLAGEQATRLGEFRRALPREANRGFAGRAGREPTKLELEHAGFESRDLIDFGRMGAKVQALNQLSAFFNANIQGTARLVEAFAQRPGPTLLKAFVGITLPSILLRLSNEGEEGYEELPQWQKNLFWVVPIGEGADRWWARIPKPFEAGVLFGTLPERMIDYHFKQDPKVFDGYLASLAGAFVPNPLPTASVPIIEAFANRSLFTGRPIIPHNREQFLPEFQYHAYTTGLTKAVGRMIATSPLGKLATDTPLEGIQSPAIIDNFVRGWGGGLGTTVVFLANRAAEAAGLLPEPNRPSDTASDLPFIKGWVIRHPTAGSESITQFYNHFEKHQQRILTYQGLARDGEFDASLALIQAFAPYTVNLTEMRNTLTDVSRLIRMITRDPNIPKEQKNQQIEELRWIQIGIAKAGNNIYSQIEEKLPLPGELRHPVFGGEEE